MGHLRMMHLSAMKLRWVTLVGLLLVVSAVSVYYARTRSKTRRSGTAAQAATPAPATRRTVNVDVTYEIRNKDDSMFANGDLLARVNEKTQIVMSDAGLTGSFISVFFNPANPAQAVLEPGKTPYIAAGVVGGIFILLGLGILWFR